MPKFQYTRLRVMCFDVRDFPIEQLRDAVEYLRTVPETGYTGLVASTLVRVGKIRLLSEPMLQLRDILGKTPAQVWRMFDQRVAEEMNGLARQLEFKL